MKKSLSVLLVLFVLSNPAYSLAQSTTPALTPTVTVTATTTKGFLKEFRDKFREVREDRRENRQEARATIKEDREEMRQDIKNLRLSGTPSPDRKGTISATKLQFRKDRLTAVYTAIKANLEARFKLLDETIKVKVQAKIDEQTLAGKNTAEAKAKLATYNTSAYTASLTAFNAKYQETLNSPEPKNMLKDLNNSAKAVRQELTKLRQTLFEAFRLAIRAK